MPVGCSGREGRYYLGSAQGAPVKLCILNMEVRNRLRPPKKDKIRLSKGMKK